MNATRKVIKQANEIAHKYSKWMEMKNVTKMYDELAELGITVGMLVNGRDSCEWYINDEQIENSSFVFQIYKGHGLNDGRAEFNIYFS